MTVEKNTKSPNFLLPQTAENSLFNYLTVTSPGCRTSAAHHQAHRLLEKVSAQKKSHQDQFIDPPASTFDHHGTPENSCSVSKKN